MGTNCTAAPNATQSPLRSLHGADATLLLPSAHPLHDGAPPGCSRSAALLRWGSGVHCTHTHTHTQVCCRAQLHAQSSPAAPLATTAAQQSLRSTAPPAAGGGGGGSAQPGWGAQQRKGTPSVPSAHRCGSQRAPKAEMWVTEPPEHHLGCKGEANGSAASPDLITAAIPAGLHRCTYVG